jgi:hypothetical protein
MDVKNIEIVLARPQRCAKIDAVREKPPLSPKGGF